MATSPCTSFPDSCFRSCSTAKTTWTGARAGEPCGTSFNDVAFKVSPAFAYVAESDNWAKVSTEWTQLLKEYKVPHFHMNELRNVTKGLYRHLSMPARMRLLDGLIGTLKKYALFGCLITLRPHEYAIVADQQFRNRYGSAYGMCVNLLLRQLHNSLLNPLSGPETINVFLERGHANEGDAIRQLKDWKELTDPPPNEVEGQPVERKAPHR